MSVKNVSAWVAAHISRTTEILKAAHQHGGTALKRFVLLGSAVSVLNSFEDMSKEGKPYTEKDWNPVKIAGVCLIKIFFLSDLVQATAEQAIDRNDPVLGYNVSKTRAEAAAWNFMKQSTPSFELAVINPDIITGPMIHPISGPQSINQTNQFAIASFIDGTHKEIEGVTFPFYHFVSCPPGLTFLPSGKMQTENREELAPLLTYIQVDVRDVARSLVDALENPSAPNHRILLISGLISPQLVANTIRKNFPALANRVPKGNPSQILPPGVHPTGWDMRESLRILADGTKEGKWEYIGLETSVVDFVESMIKNSLI